MADIETGKPICVRCQKPMFNAFREREWCYDCEIILKDLSFDGVEVLEMILAIMPPMPTNAPPNAVPGVPLVKLLQIAARVMIQVGIFPEPEKKDNQEDSGPEKPLIGV